MSAQPERNAFTLSAILPDMGRRRSQRQGYLYEKSGSWILQWREDGKDIAGRPTRDKRSMVIARSEGQDKVSKRQAQKIAWDTVLSRLETVSLHPGSMVKFGDFVRERFEPDHMWALKPAGREHYRYLLSNHLLPFFASYQLRDITPAVVQTFFRQKREKFSSQTLAHMRNGISAVLRHAETCGLFTGTLPTKGLKLPPVENKERAALNVEDAKRLIAALPGQYSTLAALMLTTGLRIGEAAGLKWRRVDALVGTLEIRETFSKGVWVSPKSPNSVRMIPVPVRVLNAMLELKSRGHHIGPDDTVFLTTHGNPVGSHTTAAKILKPVARKLGMPWVCWHSFRHSNATFADNQGMTVAGRRKLLGHGSDAMSMRYTHPEVERAREVIESIAASVLPDEENPWIT